MVFVNSDNSLVVRKNQRILLVRRPEGLPRPDDFELEETDRVVPTIWFDPRRSSSRKDRQGERSNSNTTADLVLETLYVSIDPAMRGWMSSAKSYLPPVTLGSCMRASTVSRVIAASSDALDADFPIGSIVRSEIVGVQSDYVLNDCTLSKARKLLTRLDHNTGIVRITSTNSNRSSNSNSNSNSAASPHKLSYASYLGVLGTTGLTAYFGLLRVGNPQATDTVLVSGAAGATGSIVAQIAKHVIGCQTVIGTAGSDAKCHWLESNGIVDVAINYKTVPSLSKAIARAAGKHGVNLVFDNVGSAFLEASLSNLASGATVVLCGAISQYNASQSSTATGPRNYMNLLVKRATMTGFVVFDYQNEYPGAISDMVRWIGEGKIKCYGEDMRYAGIDQFYPALLSLFKGTNIGKVVLKAKTDETETENENENENGNGNGNGNNNRYEHPPSAPTRSKL